MIGDKTYENILLEDDDRTRKTWKIERSTFESGEMFARGWLVLGCLTLLPLSLCAVESIITCSMKLKTISKTHQSPTSEKWLKSKITTLDVKNYVNKRINYQPQLVFARFLKPSAVSPHRVVILQLFRSCMAWRTWVMGSWFGSKPGESTGTCPAGEFWMEFFRDQKIEGIFVHCKCWDLVFSCRYTWYTSYPVNTMGTFKVKATNPNGSFSWWHKMTKLQVPTLPARNLHVLCWNTPENAVNEMPISRRFWALLLRSDGFEIENFESVSRYFKIVEFHLIDAFQNGMCMLMYL